VLDIGLLQAGASMKASSRTGSARSTKCRRHCRSSCSSTKRTLIGAGGAAGTGDAANQLTGPALARGKLRTIGATTWAEYKKHIEKDPERRALQVVMVDEPSEEKAVLMLRGVALILEKHHRVALLDEAITSAVRLSHRYIPAASCPTRR
jgi:type VI secretion system protein VasG